MKKITEASTLSGLGIPDKLVNKIHKSHDLAHDDEFEELTTKGQMQAKLKNGKLIIGISPDGKIASLGKDYGWGSSKSIDLTIDGKSEYTRNMKDALALVPGRGWKWFASKEAAGKSRPDNWRQKRDERDASDEKVQLKLVRALDRVYAGKIKADADKYADELRTSLITMIDAEQGADIDRGKAYDSDQEFAHAKSAYRFLKTVANSKDPFYKIAKNRNTSGFVHRITQYLANEVGYSEHDESTLAIWLRNEKLATQKVVKHFSDVLKNYRDKSLKAKGDAKIGGKVKKFSAVKKAWESYKETGEVNILSEDAFDDYATEVDPYSGGYKAGMKQEASSAFQAYKAWIAEIGGGGSTKKSEAFVRGWNDGKGISGVGPVSEAKRIPKHKLEWGKPGSKWDKNGDCKKCAHWPDGFDPRPKTYGDMCAACDGDGHDLTGWSIRDNSALANFKRTQY